VLDADPAPPLQKWGRAPLPPIFGPCLLWPNRCTDQDVTWYGGRPRPRPYCVTWGTSSPEKEPQFRPVSIVAKRSPISATAEHLLHSSPQSPYTLQWAAILPRSCPSRGEMWTPSNTWFLGPTRMHTSNSMPIGSTVCAWAHDRDRQTNRRPRYSVCNNMPHLRSTAMRPKTVRKKLDSMR